MEITWNGEKQNITQTDRNVHREERKFDDFRTEREREREREREYEWSFNGGGDQSASSYRKQKWRNARDSFVGVSSDRMGKAKKKGNLSGQVEAKSTP